MHPPSNDVDPLDIGSEGPFIEEKPYKIIFEATRCIGAGRCAEVSDNWKLALETGIDRLTSFFIDEDELAESVRAGRVVSGKEG